MDSPSYTQLLLELVAILAALGLLAWFVLRGLGASRQGRRGPIEILARARLDGDHSLFVVRIGDRVLLLGGGGGSLTTLADLSDDERAVGELHSAKHSSPAGFADFLRATVGKSPRESTPPVAGEENPREGADG